MARCATAAAIQKSTSSTNAANTSGRRAVNLALLLAALSGCCASLSQPQRRARAQEQRAILNEGYSMLHGDITKVGRFDLVFFVKVEADTVEQLAREVSDWPAH